MSCHAKAAPLQDNAGAFNQHATTFDDLFGPSFASPTSSTPPPPTTFAANTGRGPSKSPYAMTDQHKPSVSEMDASQQPKAEAASLTEQSTPVASRQMSTSSVPSSGGVDPAHSVGSLPSIPAVSSSPFGFASQEALPNTLSGGTGAAEQDLSIDKSKSSSFFDLPGAEQNRVPGEFPGDYSTPLDHTPTEEKDFSGGSKENGKVVQNELSPVPETGRDDFDAAFAAFDAPKQGQAGQLNGVATNGLSRSPPGPSDFDRTFPRLNDLVHEDDSDSASEQRFDDDFTPVSPQAQGTKMETANEYGDGKATSASSTVPATTSEPTAPVTRDSPNADEFFTPAPVQAPSRTDSFPFQEPGSQSFHSATSDHQAPSQDAAAGMTSTSGASNKTAELSSRAAQTLNFFSRPNAPDSSGNQAAASSSYMAPSVKSDPQPQTSQQPPSQATSGFDEFDDDFNDLADAKESDDKESTDLGLSAATPHSDNLGGDFDLAFDSPAAASTTTAATTTNSQYGGLSNTSIHS